MQPLLAVPSPARRVRMRWLPRPAARHARRAHLAVTSALALPRALVNAALVTGAALDRLSRRRTCVPKDFIVPRVPALSLRAPRCSVRLATGAAPDRVLRRRICVPKGFIAPLALARSLRARRCSVRLDRGAAPDRVWRPKTLVPQAFTVPLAPAPSLRAPRCSVGPAHFVPQALAPRHCALSAQNRLPLE